MGAQRPTARPFAGGYSGELPEDFPGAEIGSAKQRDVYSLARLICQILGANPPVGGSNAVETSSMLGDFSVLSSCLQRALATKPSQRFLDAEKFSDEFAATIEDCVPDRVDQSLLDRVETREIPYVQYPQLRMLENSARVNLYIHRTESLEDLSVKIWPGVRRGTAASDITMARLFEGVGRLKVSPF